MSVTLDPLVLLDFIAQRGGIHAVLAQRGLFEDCPRTGETFNRNARTYYRIKADALASRPVSLARLDFFCCKVLGIHPYEVFRDAYFPELTPELADATSNREVAA